MRCPHCANQRVEPPACAVCGFDVDEPPRAIEAIDLEPTLHAPAAPLAADEPKPEPGSYVKRCMACGVPNRPSSERCGGCGEKL